MDTQQDQSDPTNPTNAGRNPQSPAAMPGNPRSTTTSPASPAGSAAAAPRKPVAMPVAPTTVGPTNPNPTEADRQRENPPTSAPEGKLTDTVLQSGREWVKDSGVLSSVKQLPQVLKDFGNRAVARVGDLSTTQKVVGGTILAVGLGWLATRKGKPTTGNAPYNYGRAKSGSYGRQGVGYQASDAATSRRTTSGGTNRSDSGAPYGNGTSRYGTSPEGPSGSGGPNSGADFGALAPTDHSSLAAQGSARPTPGTSRFGSNSDE